MRKISIHEIRSGLEEETRLEEKKDDGALTADPVEAKWGRWN